MSAPRPPTGFLFGLVCAGARGIEATGHTRWFERMLAELGHELWIGDAAQSRAWVVRKQKTDARDAAHLLELLLRNRFPRIWRPKPMRGITECRNNFTVRFS